MKDKTHPAGLRVIEGEGLDLTLHPSPMIRISYDEGSGREMRLTIEVWRIFQFRKIIYLTASRARHDDVWDYRLDRIRSAKASDGTKIVDLLSYLKGFSDPSL